MANTNPGATKDNFFKKAIMFFKNLGLRVVRSFKDMYAELKKVSWPSRADTLKKTGIVIVCVIVVGIIVWIFDGIASAVINALLSLFGH